MYAVQTGMGFWGAASAVVAGAAESAEGKEWYDWSPWVADQIASIGDKISGVSCWRGYSNQGLKYPCPNTPNFEAVLRAVERAPDSEIQQIIQYLKRAKDGRGPSNRQELMEVKCLPKWVKALLGGGDCQASKFPEAPIWFRDFVATYGAPETPDEEQPGTTVDQAIQRAGISLGALAAAGALAYVVATQLGK